MKDFFISYNKADRTWAEWIAWQLEKAGYTTVIQAWDFRPGSNFVWNMQQATAETQRTIAVLSPDYLNALYTQPEWAAAFAQDPTGKHGTLLPIRVRECELKGLLSQIVYIDLVGQVEEVARKVLLAGLNQERVDLTTAPAFPGIAQYPGTTPPSFPGGLSALSPDSPTNQEQSVTLSELTPPDGPINPNDSIYIEREADIRLKREIVKRGGNIITIRAPRQTGRTSLLVRGIEHAHQHEYPVVQLDLEGFTATSLVSLDVFLKKLAQSICDMLKLDEDRLEQAWRGNRSTEDKFLRFMEEYVLLTFDKPIILALDNADHLLLHTKFYKDFFQLIRFWHNLRAHRKIWQKLNFVLVISTEPYLLVDSVTQSPFNVGLELNLNDFNETQVRNLNQQHGSPVKENDLPQLVALLGGHPFLTRWAFYIMVTEDKSWVDLSIHAATDDGPFSSHLRKQYGSIRDKPKLKQTLKQIIQTNRCSDETNCFRLLQAGLIKGSGEAYRCRCDLYTQYFKDKLW